MATRGSGVTEHNDRSARSAERAERRALDDLFSAAYEELRRLAASVRRDDPAATISPTALVNEAWLKLADTPAVARTSPLHFKRIAARAMRQVLVEAARRRNAEKRGGGVAVVTFDDSMSGVTTAADILGRSWIRVPGGGDWLLLLRRPTVLGAVAAGVAAFWFFLRGGRQVRLQPEPETPAS